MSTVMLATGALTAVLGIALLAAAASAGGKCLVTPCYESGTGAATLYTVADGPTFVGVTAALVSIGQAVAVIVLLRR